MQTFMPKSLTAAGFALALALSACGSDAAETTTADERDAPVETAAPTTTEAATTTTEAAEEKAAEVDEEAGAETTDASDDDAMADEAADDGAMIEGDPEDDGLESLFGDDADEAAMLGFMFTALGVEDVESASTCVVDRLESEGYSVDMEGDFSREIVALVGCEPDVFRTIAESGLLPAEIDVEDETLSCIYDEMSIFIGSVPLEIAPEVMDTEDPPQEMVDAAVNGCDVSEEELLGILG
jgi:hypothetical protein